MGQINKGVGVSKRKERKIVEEGRVQGQCGIPFLFPSVEPSTSPGTVSVRLWNHVNVGSYPGSVTYWPCALRQDTLPPRH